MTAYTKAQLRDRVLQELGILATGETATAEDAALVETTIDDQHAMLDREVFVTWVTSAIPDTVIEPLTVVLAARLAGRYGLPADRRQELLTLAALAMGELRTQVQAETDTAPIPAVYY